MVVIDHVSKLLLKWKRLQVFPCKVLSLEDIDSILQLVYFLRLPRHKLFVFLEHASKDHDIVWVKAKSEVVSNFLWHLDIQNCPNAQLDIVSLYRVQELIFSGQATKQVEVLWTALTRAGIDSGDGHNLALLAQCPLPLPDLKSLERA